MMRAIDEERLISPHHSLALDDQASWATLKGLLENDLESVERALKEIQLPEDLVGSGSRHLLSLPGKRLRPLCLMLASQFGSASNSTVVDLAVGVELVHAATLLHDDVIDVGTTRRGAPTVRVRYGDAVSLLSGDWLLMEAFIRTSRAAVPGVLDDLFSTLQETIHAESLQFENRSWLCPSRSLYFQTAEGKTAALFRWALRAGATVGGVPNEQRGALDRFGRQMGIAFQILDDLADLAECGKPTNHSFFADILQGNVSFPLVLALERHPHAEILLREVVTPGGDEARCGAAQVRLSVLLSEPSLVEGCHLELRQRVAEALASLAPLPECPAKNALASIAKSILTASNALCAPTTAFSTPSA